MLSLKSPIYSGFFFDQFLNLNDSNTMDSWILTDHVCHNGGINNLEVNKVISGNQILAFYTGKTSKWRANKFIKLLNQTLN